MTASNTPPHAGRLQASEDPAEVAAILQAAAVPISDEELARQALAAAAADAPEPSGRAEPETAEPLGNEVGRVVWAMEHGVASEDASHLIDPQRITPPDWLEPPTVVAPVLPPEQAIAQDAPPISDAELEAQALAAQPETEVQAVEEDGLVDQVGQALWALEHGVVPPEVVPPPTAAQLLISEAQAENGEQPGA